MTETITQIGTDFWRIQGEHRIGGLLDVGTQCSLVRLADGRFVFLDSYTLPGPVMEEVYSIVGSADTVAAILNLHPFHTLHCAWMHHAFPSAALYGTARHIDRLPDLPWQTTRCEDAALRQTFGADFAFSVPEGMPLVCDSESVHFSSILAYHRASGVIHVDDTLNFLDKGGPLALLPMNRRLDFHPTLAQALDPRASAADEFREWAIALGIEWADARTIATAHNSVRELEPEEFPKLIGEALGRVKPVLDRHRAKHG